MDSEPRQRQRRPMTEVARRLRRSMTAAEERLWSILRGKQCGGLRFLRQHDAGHYVLDFYCASACIAIEVDGSVHDLPEVAANDAEREKVLRETFGIRVVRMRNDFVLSASPGEVCATVLAFSQSLPPSKFPSEFPSLILMREGVRGWEKKTSAWER